MEYGSAYNYTMEKTAGIGNLLAAATADPKRTSEMMSVVGKGLGMAGISAVVFKSIINKIQNDMRRKAIIEDLANYDPMLKNVDREQLKEWFATMYYYAPTMTADKNTVREILTGFARFGKVDLSTLKTLAETEEKLRKASGDSFLNSIISPIK